MICPAVPSDWSGILFHSAPVSSPEPRTSEVDSTHCESKGIDKKDVNEHKKYI